MPPERWQQIERLYHSALECAPEDRAVFLSQACAEDAELHREVESLLAAHDQAGTFIDHSPDDVAAGMMAEGKARSVIGRTLGHYTIQSKIGAGGMGEVYRAHDLRLDRDVAVKILPEHLAQDAEALRRFELEAKAVAALSHPNILAIFDFGTEEGVSYAVMELLEGETLRARLQRGAIPWREAVEIGTAVAEGLAAAHAKNIIHRDLKPENIFLTTGKQVKILDFGIARVKRAVTPDAETLTAGIETTKHGVVMGTLGYMSPEQVKGEAAEAPSDIFSLGCVLYEMVSGQRPFARTTTAETIAAILDAEPLPLTQTGKNTPIELERVCHHCLKKADGERYQSARDLGFDLRQLLNVSGEYNHPASVSPVLSKKNKLLVVVAAILILTVASIVLFISRNEAIDSLAVLPLLNTSGDENVEYLSESITDALINNLSQLPQLKRVIARSTVATYKGREIDPRVIGKDLHVRSILTGKLTRRGDELLIAAELVNTDDGSRLWGDNFKRKFTEAMLIQAELGQLIAQKLRLKLTGAEQQKLTKRPTDNSEAYGLYVKGRYYSQLQTTDGTKKGIELLQQAVRLDPTYALAYAGLASSYYDASSRYWAPSEATPKVKEAAEKALQLDETLAEAHTALAQVKGFYELDWVRAEKELKQALEHNPGFARAAHVYGTLLVELGRMEEALSQLKRARELDPLALHYTAWIAFFYYLNRQYDESIRESKKLVEADRTFVMGHINLAIAYEQQGLFAEAEAELDLWKTLDPENLYPNIFRAHIYSISGKREAAQKILLDLLKSVGAPQNYIDPFFIGLVYAGLDEKDQAFAWLERAYQAKSEDLLNIRKEPRLDSLRNDPRFTDLMRRLKLAP